MRFKWPARLKLIWIQLLDRIFDVVRKVESLALARSGKGGGCIKLVGAGPGDPELLTLKALKAIQNADVILHDRLVGPEILAFARRSTKLVYVGKIGRGQSTPQEAIQARMIAEALDGKRVVRLKGGDPFIFGRGGEELEAARLAGIPVEVVPGVSAALGAAAAVQVPLTHRDHAQTLILATGHCKSEGGQGAEPNLDWDAMANPNATLAIYMGVATAGIIADRLIDAGRDEDTPVAAIENATLPTQIVVRTTLEFLTRDMATAGISGPAVLLIGEAVADADDFGLMAQAHSHAQDQE